MNSLERVTATIAGSVRDRPPFSMTLSLYGARLTDCPLKDYYSDPEAYARGQTAIREIFAPDILFGPFALALEGAAFGSEVQFYRTQAPNLRTPILSSAADVSRLTVPDPDRNPCLTYFRDAIRAISAAHGEEVAVAAIALSPVDLPIMLLGIEGWLETVLFDEAGTRRVLDVTVPFYVRRVNSLFEAGAHMVVMPSSFVNPAIVTREVVQDIAIPALAEAFADVNGPLLLHSVGVPLAPFLDLFPGLPNVVGFVVNCGEDIEAARDTCGPDVVVVGNIDGPQLQHATPERIVEEAQALLDAHGSDPRFVLGTSAADIAYATAPGNIHALSRVARAGEAAGGPVCISCSIFRSEIKALQARGEAGDVEFRYLPSMLHLEPSRLERRLNRALDKALDDTDQVLLLYGDCHPRMHEQEAVHGVSRTEGNNCLEILLGSERYQELLEEGVFFLLPEWTLRWKEIFQVELGLSGEITRDMMTELHTRLLYLDTGVMDVPEGQLDEIASFTGLPWTAMAVDCDRLGAALRNHLDI